MEWVNADEKDFNEMGKKHWRCGITKEPISCGVAYRFFFTVVNEHPVEWLDESTPVLTLQQGLDIWDAARLRFDDEFYNGGYPEQAESPDKAAYFASIGIDIEKNKQSKK